MSKFNEAINYIAKQLQKKLPDRYQFALYIDNDEVDISVYDDEGESITVYSDRDCTLDDILGAIEQHKKA